MCSQARAITKIVHSEVGSKGNHPRKDLITLNRGWLEL